jgi:hypothetical protein
MQLHLLFDNVDTVVNLSPTHKKPIHYHQTLDRKKVFTKKVMKFDSKLASNFLLQMDDLSDKLKSEDPEYDIELTGKTIEHTVRIVVNPKTLDPVYSFKEVDILERADQERLERPHTPTVANINEPIPVKVTDTYHTPKELLQKYIFRKSYYLSHIDGMTYKFLFDIAKFLEDLDKFVRLQAYDQETKKPTALIMRTGGIPFPAAYLEGKTNGNQYCLVLHLADRELKLPTAGETEEEDQ